MTKIKVEQLQMAQQWLREIKKLDNQIMEIQTMANLVSKGNVKCAFDLKVVDLQKQADDKTKVGFDEDGSLKYFTSPASDFHRMMNEIREMHWQPMGYKLGGPVSDDKTKVESFTKGISDTSVLRILGIILEDKQRERAVFIANLEKLGFELS